MKNILSFAEYQSLQESIPSPQSQTSGNVVKPKPKRDVFTSFDHTKYPELSTEFFNLIQTAYAEIGGHLKVTTPNDVFKDPDWNFWAGVDLHDSPDFDLIMFGSKTKFGVKYSGVGHDGSKEAKRAYMDKEATDLKKMGYYSEVSEKLAEILINKYNVPIVDDPQTVEKVLGKKVNWYGKNPDNPNASGHGWYGRMIGGRFINKIMVGKPKA